MSSAHLQLYWRIGLLANMYKFVLVSLIKAVLGFANVSSHLVILDVVNIFLYLPRDLNFLEHSSNIGLKE